MALSSYTSLVVSDKAGIENVMSIYLKNAGISRFVMAHSQREAVTKANAEIPHVILVVGDTADSSAIQTIEAIRRNPLLDRALVFLVKACSQDELVKSVKLRVAAVITNAQDPNVLIEKIKSKLNLLNGLSPYAVKGEQLEGGNEVVLKVPISVVGRTAQNLLCRGNVGAHYGTVATIEPKDSALQPFVVTFSSQAGGRGDGDQLNFAFDGIIGKGKAWLLTKISESTQPVNTRKPRMLLFERAREKGEALRKMLEYYSIEAEHVDSISSLCAMVKTRPDDFCAIYFYESLVGAMALPWVKTKKELPPEKLLVEITATSSLRPTPAPQVIWLQKPFGIQQVAQSYEIARAARTKGTGTATATTQPIPCQCITKARLVALDETGGVLMTKLDLPAQAELSLTHPLLASNPIFATTKVVDSEPHGMDPSLKLVRFAFGSSLASKEKHWTAAAPILEKLRAGRV